jgi:predicted Mrr-cat superfamily restriction endonuclease
MKSKKFLLPMKLQFFSEDPEGGTPPEGGQGATHPDPEKPEGGKTFSRDEVSKMLNAERDKIKKELEDKQAEAEKLAKMNAEEKAKHEKQQLEAKVAKLEREAALKEMASEASKMLSEAELPHDEDLIALVTREDAEETKKAVEVITSFVSKIKKENARQMPPVAGGQFSGSDKNRNTTKAEMAKEVRIIK